MSRAPRRPRSVKVEDELWQAAKIQADECGDVLSEVIREALKRYVAGEMIARPYPSPRGPISAVDTRR